MEQNQNRLAPEAPADESASPVNHAAGDSYFSPPPREDESPPSGKVTVPDSLPDPPLLSDSLGAALQETLDATFTPDSRKPRHDGWTPEAVAGFLHALAETGVVEHAARRVGLSAQSAYAFRNRRQGRAFAKVWDAVLVNRARARVEGELQGRAVAGCVSIRKHKGEVVGEYHYYDNRLAMSLLTRLDRLAERAEPEAAHLRALSEDLDEFCDCLAEGGDPDAFVAARLPEDHQEKEPEMPAPANGPDDQFAILNADIPLTGDEVWEDEDGAWWTLFPPPAFFKGVEWGRFGDPDYRRTLSDDERAVVDDDIEDREAQELVREAGRRDRFFGFEGGLANADWEGPGEEADQDDESEPPEGPDE